MIFAWTSTTGNGRGELLGVIGATLSAIPAQSEPSPPVAPLPPEVEPLFSMQVRAGNTREKDPRKKLKGARPW
jgi:hypothetical protein